LSGLRPRPSRFEIKPSITSLPEQSRAQPVAEGDLLDIAELLRTLSRYKWSIVGIALLSMLGTAFYGYSQDKYYLTATTLLIETRVPNPIQVRGVLDADLGDKEYLGTQYEMLRSRDLAGKVVDKLGLIDHPEFQPEPPTLLSRLLDWRTWLPFLETSDGPAAPAQSPEEIQATRRDAVTLAFLQRVKILPVRGTQLVRVGFKSRYPALAQKAANTLADQFIESALQARLDVTRRTSEWLTMKLGDMRAQLEKSEKALQQYREQEKLVNVNGARTLNEDELVETTRRLRDAQRRKTELASTYARVQQAGNDPQKLSEIPALLQDTRVVAASHGFMEAAAQLKAVRERYGEKHPSMAAVKARHDGAQNAYFDALRVAAQGLKSDYEIAQANERALGEIVANSRESIERLDKKQYEMGQLEREVATNREMYNMFLTRFKETDSINNYENLTARVIDAALVPRVPFEPKVGRMVMIAGLVGLMIGLVLAVLRHLLSEEIRSAEDLEALSQVPVVGIITKVDKEDARGLATLFLTKPQTPFSEGIRSIRTALQLSDVDKKYHRLLVTSSVPAEGKTSLACALAESFAAVEQVLLVDADLRRPSLASRLAVPEGAPGLTELLAGQARLEDCLYLHQESGIYLLPAGKHVPNPAEVLASLAFKSLMEELSRRFYRIIFDSPPCQAASDALQLSQHVDGVLFLVKSGSTSRRVIRNSYKLLRNVGAPLLGNIVNQVDVKKSGGGYYQGYYAYGYYGN
jgi:succinoglycan biosynthesis transport protein ExoP